MDTYKNQLDAKIKDLQAQMAPMENEYGEVDDQKLETDEQREKYWDMNKQLGAFFDERNFIADNDSMVKIIGAVIDAEARKRTQLESMVSSQVGQIRDLKAEIAQLTRMVSSQGKLISGHAENIEQITDTIEKIANKITGR
jgi:chromosome segregation ATPase